MRKEDCCETRSRFTRHYRQPWSWVNRYGTRHCPIFFIVGSTTALPVLFSCNGVTPRLKGGLTRFSQKCGFSGYREFVYHFNEETKNQKQVQEHDELTLSVLQRYHHISNVTESLVKDSQLDRVAELIDQVDRVYFFGIGSSGLVAREMKLRFMRLGSFVKPWLSQDGFAWTTSILDSSCLVIGFSLSGGTNSITDSLLDAKEKGAKTVLVTANPAAIHQGFTEVLPAAPLPSSTYIDRISAILPLLIVVDLIYAHFLNKSREQKEIVFNSYWENKKLSSQRSRKSLIWSPYLKSMKDRVFFIFHAFLMNQKQVASATCFMFPCFCLKW